MINLENTGTGIPIHILSTNQHALMSNIELRTMNEENNPGTGVEIIVSELQLGKQRILEDNISPSFLSIDSEQSSEKEEDKYIISMTN